MMRPAIFLLASLAGLASGASENREMELEPFAGPQRHLMVRPVAAHTDVLNVTVGMELVNVDVDEVHNKVTIDGWLQLGWTSIRLAWTDDSVPSTRVMPDQIWTPDIMPYNKVPVIGKWLQPIPAIVYPSGKVLYVPPVSFAVRCERNQTGDRDRVTCPVKLGSWTHSAQQMDLLLEKNTVDTTDFIANGNWVVESTSITRQEKTYDCCPEKYVSLNIELVLKPQRC